MYEVVELESREKGGFVRGWLDEWLFSLFSCH